MPTDPTPNPTPPNPPSSTPPPLTPEPGAATPRKKRRWLLWGCGGLLGLVLLMVATVFITLWWIQRPIKPVVLSEKEKVVVDNKLKELEAPEKPTPPVANRGAQPSTSTPVPNRTLDAVELPPVAIPPSADRTYVPGGKVLTLTEREINGLLNLNTDLGRTVRLEFAKDAVNAYIAVPIPQDFPVGGGRMFRARGRFRVSIGNGGAPFAILEDVTVFGLSLPKAWLGGIKGQNLISEAAGERNGSPILKGVKSLRVEPGALVLEVED